MDLMEIKEKERLSCRDAAARLHALADARSAQRGRVCTRRSALHGACARRGQLQARDRDQRRRAELEVELTW